MMNVMRAMVYEGLSGVQVSVTIVKMISVGGVSDLR